MMRSIALLTSGRGPDRTERRDGLNRTTLQPGMDLRVSVGGRILGFDERHHRLYGGLSCGDGDAPCVRPVQSY